MYAKDVKKAAHVWRLAFGPLWLGRKVYEGWKRGSAPREGLEAWLRTSPMVKGNPQRVYEGEGWSDLCFKQTALVSLWRVIGRDQARGKETHEAVAVIQVTQSHGQGWRGWEEGHFWTRIDRTQRHLIECGRWQKWRSHGDFWVCSLSAIL